MAPEVITLSSYWGHLVDRLPVAAVTGVTYYPDVHRSVSQNLPFADFQSMLLKQDLYDEPVGENIPFIVDLRHMAHSLLELVNYLKTGEGTRQLYNGTVFKSSQLRMPGI